MLSTADWQQRMRTHLSTHVSRAFTRGKNSLQFIQKDDAWTAPDGRLEYPGNRLFRLAHLALDQIRYAHGQEVGGRLGSHCLGQQRLTCTWWAKQQHAFGGSNAQSLVGVGVLVHPDSRFLQRILGCYETTNVMPVDGIWFLCHCRALETADSNAVECLFKVIPVDYEAC